MAVNLDACIQCTRCVRACREEQVNDVIGYAFRGAHSSDRVRPRRSDGRVDVRGLRRVRAGLPDRRARAGARAYLDADRPARCRRCARTAASAASSPTTSATTTIVRVEGRDGPGEPRAAVRQGPLRLRLRRAPAPAHQAADPPRRRAEDPPTSRSIRRIRSPVFREATWEEALALAGGTLAHDPRHARAAARSPASARRRAATRRRTCSRSSCARASARNNVDHCTRLCHASSVAALLEGIGSGAVSNPVMDVMKAEVVLLIGANPVVNHPVAATWIKNAVEERHEADPRRPAPLRARAPCDALPAVQARHRRRAAERDDAHDRRGRPRRRRRSSPTARAATRSWRRTSPSYSPEAMAPVCGIPARDDPRGRARCSRRRRAR